MVTKGETGRGKGKQKVLMYYLVYMEQKRNEHPNVGGVSMRGRNGASSRDAWSMVK